MTSLLLLTIQSILNQRKRSKPEKAYNGYTTDRFLDIVKRIKQETTHSLGEKHPDYLRRFVWKRESSGLMVTLRIVLEMYQPQ